ncbi:TetR/AcrR family transcriptional regulator [Deinococcus ruber]|uniref:TetR family transcriptional regulator n=1 Tax=Deinococcus ruber TaxID=1848197 RepID=A0A918FB62_9DEIO|nr:TetR/AcrR family transcriptional regulator [Deinococcus ruber]GGR23110.1 TetR family transcriptional regulator [Deinococcus ruber]
MDEHAPSRRLQIIRAALQRYRTHTVSGTTLRDVAQAAGLPLGNLYYYVRSRDDLVLEVLDECERELQQFLARLAPLTPLKWLSAYFDWLLSDPDQATALGCPFGTLPGELRALGHPAADRAAQIVRQYRDAVSKQTQAAGIPTEVFMAVQGTYTVARILNDPALFKQEIQRIRDAALPGSSRDNAGETRRAGMSTCQNCEEPPLHTEASAM